MNFNPSFSDLLHAPASCLINCDGCERVLMVEKKCLEEVKAKKGLWGGKLEGS
jgi:hypothetical protein